MNTETEKIEGALYAKRKKKPANKCGKTAKCEFSFEKSKALMKRLQITWAACTCDDHLCACYAVKYACDNWSLSPPSSSRMSAIVSLWGKWKKSHLF
jgi:hypothetical protein